MTTARNLERRLDRLTALAQERVRERSRLREEQAAARDFLEMAPRTLDTLETLSTALFGEIESVTGLLIAQRSA